MVILFVFWHYNTSQSYEENKMVSYGCFGI